MTTFEIVKTIFLVVMIVVLLVTLRLLQVAVWCEEVKQRNEDR